MICKEEILVFFMVLPQQLPGLNKENHKVPQDSWSFGRDLNLGSC
jgi:hypothetical protein